MNKYITVAYCLYDSGSADAEMVEEATDKHPFSFISGLGITLDSFELHLLDVEKGQNFDFTLSVDEAYGPHMQELVQELPRSAFEIDGKFDATRIYEGAVVPLMNAEGQHFPGTVSQVTDSTVTVDLNNPLAGKELRFTGKILENREATPEEIREALQEASCGGCGGGCGDCGVGDCGGGCGGCGGGCN
ncbi:MAG: peptidylprolyl isomerase [Bacteroidaceae bacterium]|nr:peptidylprolyl isomerase [Bacteroidaceae bacterium]